MVDIEEKNAVNTTEEEKNQIHGTADAHDVINNNTHHLIKTNLISFLEKQIQESNAKILEAQLNFENEIQKIKNRLGKEIENNRKFCLEKIIISFLPIIDNIERALDSLNTNEKSENNLLIIKKLNITFQLLQEILKIYHIRKINDTEVMFDPSIHQAMSIHYSNEIPSNQVITVMQSGYIFYESRLLRPAMVIVSQQK